MRSYFGVKVMII